MYNGISMTPYPISWPCRFYLYIITYSINKNILVVCALDTIPRNTWGNFPGISSNETTIVRLIWHMTNRLYALQKSLEKLLPWLQLQDLLSAHIAFLFQGNKNPTSNPLYSWVRRDLSRWNAERTYMYPACRDSNPWSSDWNFQVDERLRCDAPTCKVFPFEPTPLSFKFDRKLGNRHI